MYLLQWSAGIGGLLGSLSEAPAPLPSPLIERGRARMSFCGQAIQMRISMPWREHILTRL